MNLRMIDIMSVFNVEPEDCKGWPAPNMILKEDGIWVESPSDLPEKIRNVLTIEEFIALFDHPTGDYTVPALYLPCSLETFVSFMCEQDIFEFGEIERVTQQRNDTVTSRLLIENLRNTLRTNLIKKIKDYLMNLPADGNEYKPSIKICQEKLIISTIINLGYTPLKLPKNNGKKGIKKEVWIIIKNKYIGNINSFNSRWKTMRSEGKLNNA